MPSVSRGLVHLGNSLAATHSQVVNSIKKYLQLLCTSTESWQARNVILHLLGFGHNFLGGKQVVAVHAGSDIGTEFAGAMIPMSSIFVIFARDQI